MFRAVLCEVNYRKCVFFMLKVVDFVSDTDYNERIIGKPDRW